MKLIGGLGVFAPYIINIGITLHLERI